MIDGIANNGRRPFARGGKIGLSIKAAPLIRRYRYEALSPQEIFEKAQERNSIWPIFEVLQVAADFVWMLYNGKCLL